MIAVNIEDLRIKARHRLPRIFFDYLDGGSFSETTLRRNRADFERLVIEQRVMADVSSRDLSHSFLGRQSALPFMLGPIGFCGMMAPDGEAKSARAAEKAGINFCLSTFSIASIERTAAAIKRPIAYQLYVFRNRELAENMMERAAGVGVETLFLTVDTVVSGVRERDVRNGFRSASRLSSRNMLDFAMHPRWSLAMARHGKPQLGNVAGRPEMGNTLMQQATKLASQTDPSLAWSDMAWLRRQWKGRLVVKGILSVQDARRAVDEGADGVVVSNHGGRQLDSTHSTISVLPSIAKALGGRTEILLDSGIRRGTDIFKALALGADGVLLGRSYIYGLAAAGEAGVSMAIEHMRAELSNAMALSGIHSIAELKALGPEIVGGL